MNRVHREQVTRGFSRASDYDGKARVQRRVAQALAERIAELPLPASPRILEIGCGTGFLTNALLKAGLAGEWLITDLSPGMVERCRAGLGATSSRRFAVLDGEYGVPEGAGGFDLVCSSLAMQWFDCHAAALKRMLGWLTPGGHCIFTTLASASLQEWRRAHEDEHLAYGTPSFPNRFELNAVLPEAQAQPHRCEEYSEVHCNALDFLRSLKAIGAGTPSRSHRPLDPWNLRRVMRNFEASGSRVTYEVVTCHYRRAGSAVQ